MQSLDGKKVTFLISSLVGGGAEGVCVNVANGLAKQGWSVDLVVLHLNNAAYHDRVSDEVNLVVLDVSNARYAGLPLLKYIRQQKPKTVLVFNYELAVVLVMLRTIFRFKTTIIARNINTLSKKRNQAQGFWRKYVVKPLIDGFYCKVDHVINQCQAMREDLISLYPQLAEKSSVIYNPVAKHIEDYAKSNDLNQVEKQDCLLCVGRLEKQKGFHYAIEGFARVADDFPNLRLKIVGQGSLEQELKQCAVDFGVANRVDFEGFQKDMLPYYLNAKATVLTSIYEGFPNVLVESITLGTPVIAFDCPSGPSEIIEDGVNGYLVKYQDVEDFRSKLVKLINLSFNPLVINATASKNRILEVAKKYQTLLSSVG
ncbi:glycosyltransferase [Aliidiomarina sanyensis]|uniref:Glycosyl transferase n=1 Tax=Aliidiomarina sanyensis TaxID=1249555 RepID=A0A432WAY7_9GAMM|nr:glycosyltransferase [Aliidiomarina sanyensis]RUO27872.1 glycosyl transferase [Aliidiomarina sanyensis]